MCGLPSFGCVYRLVGWISASISEVLTKRRCVSKIHDAVSQRTVIAIILNIHQCLSSALRRHVVGIN